MKVRFLKISILLGAFFLMILLLIPSGCKNPDDDNPPQDTLIDAPPSPVFQSPVDSFVYMPSNLPYYLRINWSAVTGAELYQLEVTYLENNPTVVDVTNNYYDLGFINDARFGVYRCRVRAASSAWIGGYTTWSGIKIFSVREQPHPPYLFYPGDGDTLYFDSLPGLVDLTWGRTSDEEFYELEILDDSVQIFDALVYDTSFEFELSDTGANQWRVRAGSYYWEKIYTNWTGYYIFYTVLR